jgi:type VI protein secretion system component Hcp
MSVTGATVPVTGDVTEASHEKWVAIKEVEFSIEREVRAVVGRTVDRNTEVPKISAFKFKKNVDMASFAIFQNALFGVAATKVVIDFTRQLDDGTTLIWRSFTLNNVIVSKYDSTATDQEHPTENFEMSFTMFTQMYTAYSSDGKTVLSGPSVAGFNLLTAKKVT